MYQQFQREALANAKERGYSKEMAYTLYKQYVHSLYRLARDGYYMFRATKMEYTDKCTHGKVPESQIREFIQAYYELTDEATNRVMFVMLHPEEGHPERYITERQGGGVVV